VRIEILAEEQRTEAAEEIGDLPDDDGVGRDGVGRGGGGDGCRGVARGPVRGVSRGGPAERLRQRAHAAGLVDVRIQGRVSDMPAALAEIDVLLLPARDLGGKADIPLTVLEAMATRRPVVISDLPQMSALGGAAARVPAGDVDALTAAVAGLLADPDRWTAVADAGRDLVEREYSSAAMTDRYAQLYAELLEQRGMR
jgi:glycosyltransferase involved in cell wall biosynthesis